MRNFAEMPKSGVVFEERTHSLLFGMPLFTRYMMDREVLTVREGLFGLKERKVPLHAVTEVRLSQSFLERLLGLGTVSVYMEGAIPNVYMDHIHQAKEVQAFVMDYSKKERSNRSVRMKMNIGGFGDVNYVRT